MTIMSKEILYKPKGIIIDQDIIMAFCLVFPVIAKVLLPVNLELMITPQIFGVRVFLPNFAILIFFLLSTKKSAHKIPTLLFFFQLLCAFGSLITNSYTGRIVQSITGSFYFYALIIGLFCKITEKQKVWVGRFIAFSVFLLDIEVVLFSSGILTSYNGWSTESLYTTGGFYRVVTTAGAATGCSCIIYLMSSISFLLLKENRWKIFILLSGFIATLVLASRGEIAAYLVLIIQLPFIMFKSKARTRNKFIFTIMIVFIILFFMGLFNPVIDRLQEKTTDITSGRGASIERLLNIYYQNDNELFGCGMANVYSSFEVTRSDYNVVHPMFYGAPHNMYILYLIEQGWLGAITFVLFWLSVILIAIHNKRWSILSALIPVIVILFNTETIIGVDSEHVFLWSILLMFAIEKNTEKEISLDDKEISQMKYIKSRL